MKKINIKNKKFNFLSLQDIFILFFIIILFLFPCIYLHKGDFLEFALIIFSRSFYTIFISGLLTICIFIISFLITKLLFKFKNVFSFFSLLLSMWPVVIMIIFFDEKINITGHALEFCALIFSGLLIYYFSEQLNLILKQEMKNAYVEAYLLRNHFLFKILSEAILLFWVRQFPVCCIQIATYTLFTDILIFKEVHGKGIISWFFTIEKLGLYPDKINSLYILIIVCFLLFFNIYNMTVLRFAENKILGNKR